jgi:hypothetical protein
MEAEADARLAEEVLRDCGIGDRRYTLAFMLGALVERGEVRAAASLLDQPGAAVNLSLLLDSRGRLRCAQGRFAEAVEDFLACGKQLIACGTSHPGMLAWRSSAAWRYSASTNLTRPAGSPTRRSTRHDG